MALENNGERGVNEEKGSDIQVGHILLYNRRKAPAKYRVLGCCRKSAVSLRL